MPSNGVGNFGRSDMAAGNRKVSVVSPSCNVQNEVRFVVLGQGGVGKSGKIACRTNMPTFEKLSALGMMSFIAIT